MNSSPVFSLLAVSAALLPHRRAKMTAAGVDYAGASDIGIGTLQAGDLNRIQVTILPFGIGLHFATMGNGTDIAIGDALEPAAAGKLVKKVAGPTVAIALEACTDVDDVIRVKYVDPLPVGSHVVVAAGIHDWAGGAATADTIAVAGLLVTDIVLCTLIARAAAEVLIMAANNAAADTIDLTLSANGTNTTTKVNWAVLRAV